ncbi:hypothetical protein BD770DRAFT_416986, partial [Pilaira anomala]
MQHRRFSQTYTRYQRQHFEKFREFRHKKPKYHCTLCLKLLYPEETYFREYPLNDTSLLCISWGFEPILSQDGITIAVCQNHRATHFNTNSASLLSNYPGPNIDGWLADNNFNYRERASLSPVK